MEGGAGRNLLPESCRGLKEKAQAGELSSAKTIFCSSLQKSLFLLMDLECFAHRKQKLLQLVASPPQLLLDMLCTGSAEGLISYSFG